MLLLLCPLSPNTYILYIYIYKLSIAVELGVTQRALTWKEMGEKAVAPSYLGKNHLKWTKLEGCVEDQSANKIDQN